MDAPATVDTSWFPHVPPGHTQYSWSHSNKAVKRRRLRREKESKPRTAASTSSTPSGLPSSLSDRSSIDPSRRDGWLRFMILVQYDGFDLQGWQSQRRVTQSQSNCSDPSSNRGSHAGKPKTVQDWLESKLSGLFAGFFDRSDHSNRIVVNGCSRTDAGVHAKGQCAHFDCPPLEQLPSLLPRSLTERLGIPTSNSEYESLLQRVFSQVSPTVQVRCLSLAPIGFHARCDCLGKRYIYRLHISERTRRGDTGFIPLMHRFVVHLDFPAHGNDSDARKTAKSDSCGIRSFDIEKMNDCCRRFIEGTHDFTHLSVTDPKQRRQKGREREFKERSDPMKTVKLARVFRHPDCGSMFTLVFVGDGFLYRMVRCLVGTLIQIGTGKMTISDFRSVMSNGTMTIETTELDSSGSESISSLTKSVKFVAPAHGLSLERIYYDPLQWEQSVDDVMSDVEDGSLFKLL